MPVNISSLRGERRPLAVPWGDDVVNLWYWPAVFTADYEDKLRGQMETGRNAGALAVMLLELVDEWDAIDIDAAGNEVPYPLTIETLRLIPVEFTNPLCEAIQEDARKHNPNQAALNRRARRTRMNGKS